VVATDRTVTARAHAPVSVRVFASLSYSSMSSFVFSSARTASRSGRAMTSGASRGLSLRARGPLPPGSHVDDRLAERGPQLQGPARGPQALLAGGSDADEEVRHFARGRVRGPEAVGRPVRLDSAPAEVLDGADVGRADLEVGEAAGATAELLVDGHLVDRLPVAVLERLRQVPRAEELPRAVAHRDDGDGGGERHPRRYDDREREVEDAISSRRPWTCNSRWLPGGSRSTIPPSPFRA